MPFQLSRGRLKLLTGATLAAYVVGLACLAICWVTEDLRWGHSALAALLIALAMNQRLLAGQIQRRTNEVINMYGGRPHPAPSAEPLGPSVVPSPRPSTEGEAAQVEGAEGRDTP